MTGDDRVLVSVDEDLCAGSGACVQEHPDIFAIDDLGIARVVDPERTHAAGDLDEVVVLCPAGAIRLRPVSGP